MEIFGGDHILGIFGRKKNRECSRKKKLREGENYLEEKSRNEGASLLSSNILIIL